MRLFGTEIYLKISVDVLWNDVLRLGFVLAVHDIHVQPPLLEAEAKKNKGLNARSQLNKNHRHEALELKQKWRHTINKRFLTCLMNKGASRSGSSKHFSSSPRKKL